MAQGGQHGGGQNNANKRERRAAAVQSPAVGKPAVFERSVKPPGGAHIVGGVPAPVEV